jgi:putative transposase
MANHHGRAEKELVQEEILLDDPDLNQWREQPLEAEGYPYLFVDARYEKVRVNDRVVSEGVLIVTAVRREDGLRERCSSNTG